MERERATVQDRCKGHTDGTDLVHDLTDLRENIEIDTFDYNGYKPPKGKSIAYKWIATEKAVYISLDIETGGENCGIIQLRAQVFRMVQHNSKMTSEIERECFDEQVMPSEDSIQDERLFQIHGLRRDHPPIKEADDITEVWRRFTRGNLKFDISRSLTFMLILTYSYIF